VVEPALLVALEFNPFIANAIVVVADIVVCIVLSIPTLRRTNPIDSTS
jgi:hypothetical protein